MRLVAVLVLLAAVSCSPEAPPTPPKRTAAPFVPAVEQLGEVIAGDLKKQDEKAYAQYLQETGSKDAAELGRRIGKEILLRYGDALGVEESKAQEFAAGKFDDDGNRKRVNASIGKFADTKATLPEVCRVAIQKVQSGEWKGIHLELTVRILEGQLKLAGDHQDHGDHKGHNH